MLVPVFIKVWEDNDKTDAIAKKLLLKDISFWKDVMKLSKAGSDILASTINGVSREYNPRLSLHDLIH